MSNAKSELLTFLAVAFVTLVGLFALHKAYASYLDVSYHSRIQEGGPPEALVAARQADAAQLQKGKIPLDKAMALLGRGRTRVASIAPQPSKDLSALSGWIHFPGFKPVVAHPVRIPRPPVAVPPRATEPPAAEPEKAAPAASVKAPSAPAAGGERTPKHGATNQAKPMRSRAH